MGSRPSILSCLALALIAVSALPVAAQQHRATHLGNPATRFAPPLNRPDDLRARFADQKLRLDIAAVLTQWGWKGNLEDLYRAAATARITEESIAPGTRLPFMSSRNKGRPIVLRDVLWAGADAAEAYAFVFASSGRRYRCLTPKACSNFLLIDLGPDLPSLQLELSTVATASLCDPLEVKILIRNAGYSPLTQVRVSDDLPPGWHTADNRTALLFDVGALRAGEIRELRYQVLATDRGVKTNTVRTISAEGAKAHASRRTTIQGPSLAIDCNAPEIGIIGRPVEACVSVRNSGDAAERNVIVTLPLPGDATLLQTTGRASVSAGRVVWEIPTLAAQETLRLCATLSRPDPGPLRFAPTVQGACAPPAEGHCESRVAGVPGILLEVIDVEDPVEVGHEVTYVVRITNQGSSAVTNIRPACSLPEIQDFVSATGTTQVRAEERKLLWDPVPVLDPKATATWNIVTRAREAGNALFKVDLVSDELPRAFGEGEVTNQY